MKTIIITIAALLFSATTFAQPTIEPKAEKSIPTAEQIAKQRADRMRQQLLLSDKQYNKVYKLCLEQAEKDVVIMQQKRVEKEQMAAEMKKILNEAQYERFESMQKGPRNFRHARPQGGRKLVGRHGRCDRPGVCKQPNGAPCVTRAEEKKDGARPEYKIDVEKTQSLPRLIDRNRNQNAYNYEEDAADKE